MKKISMKKVFSFILLVNSFIIFAEPKKNFELFENHWEMHFASLSEVDNPKIDEANALKYSAFLSRCIRGYEHEIIIWTGRRKTVYICSENKNKIDAYIQSEQEFFKKNLVDIAKIIKQGKVCVIDKMGNGTQDRCFIAARKSSRLQEMDLLRLGSIVMNLAQDKAEGIFSVDGCDFKVTQVDHEGDVDLKQMYPPKKDE